MKQLAAQSLLVACALLTSCSAVPERRTVLLNGTYVLLGTCTKLTNLGRDITKHCSDRLSIDTSIRPEAPTILFKTDDGGIFFYTSGTNEITDDGKLVTYTITSVLRLPEKVQWKYDGICTLDMRNNNTQVSCNATYGAFGNKPGWGADFVGRGVWVYTPKK